MKGFLQIFLISVAPVQRHVSLLSLASLFVSPNLELAQNGSWKISYYRVRFRMVLKFMAYGKVIRRGAATEPNFKSVSIHGTVLTHSQQGSVREVGFS